jgi:DNA-binding NtrC family response regulator
MKHIKELTVFIVDDDPFCLRLYQKHLEEIGFTSIYSFKDGQDCINNLTEDPAIILLDYNMNNMTGLEVLKKIKRFNPDIFTVLVSAQEDMQIAINALKYGAFDYIIKDKDDLEMMDTVLFKIDNVVKMLSKQTRSNWFSFNFLSTLF